MEAIYPKVDRIDYDEKVLLSAVLHAIADEGTLSYDADGAETVDMETVFNLCLKGYLLVLCAGEYLRPIAFKQEETKTTVVCANDTGNLTFYSAEKAAG